MRCAHYSMSAIKCTNRETASYEILGRDDRAVALWIACSVFDAMANHSGYTWSFKVSIERLIEWGRIYIWYFDLELTKQVRETERSVQVEGDFDTESYCRWESIDVCHDVWRQITQKSSSCWRFHKSDNLGMLDFTIGIYEGSARVVCIKKEAKLE